ncbi:MAG: DUF3566 domain-containing protein [Actinomycetota bacterium]
MSSREKRSGRLTESEASSASGGHLAPDSRTGPLFDPLDAPLPSESDRREREPGVPGSGARRAERTEQIARSPRTGETRTASGPRQGVRKRTGLRRVRRTIRHVDPFSVLKLSAFFYAIFVLLWLVFVALIYSMLESMGLFGMLEDLGQGLVLWDEVNITLGVVEKWALLIGVVMATLGTLVNLLLAVLYNVAADLMGGIEMTFVERDN